MSDKLTAGFPQEVWNKFRQAIPPELVSKDPNRLDYVKHQVCIEMLNECFGVDGWWQEIVTTWFQPEYPYTTKNGEKTGRAYAEVHLKLFIGAPGCEPVCRENIGAQVAGGDWSETRKGAASEALKRCASLFGWAPNVYKTETFGSHDEGASDPPSRPAAQQATRPPQPPAPATPIDHLEVVDKATFTAAMMGIGIKTPSQMAAIKDATGFGNQKIADMTPLELQSLYLAALREYQKQQKGTEAA